MVGRWWAPSPRHGASAGATAECAAVGPAGLLARCSPLGQRVRAGQRVVDFGIANAATDEKLTELGTAVGTYAYMAPERFTNDEVTYRADVYALTCVLHECLTGAQPYQGDSVSVVITAHLMQPIPKPSEQRPGIPAAFDAVIAKGMGKKPEDRYASAGDLAIAANDALSERDQDQAATILQRCSKPSKVFIDGIRSELFSEHWRAARRFWHWWRYFPCHLAGERCPKNRSNQGETLNATEDQPGVFLGDQGRRKRGTWHGQCGSGNCSIRGAV